MLAGEVMGAPILVRPLPIAAALFVAGVVLAPRIPTGLAVLLLVTSAILALRALNRSQGAFVVWGGVAFFAAGTACRVPGHVEGTVAGDAQRWARVGRVVEGIIREAPRQVAAETELLLELTGTSSTIGAPMVPASGRLLVRSAQSCGAPADRVRLYARLIPPAPTPFPGALDPRDYFDRRGAFASARAEPGMCVVVSPREDRWASFLERLRDRVHRGIDRTLPAKTASIVRAFATGDASAIDEATRTAFRRSGLSHLLAISGLNLAIIAGLVVFSLTMLLRRSMRVLLGPGAERVASWAALPAIFVYARFAGSTPSALRAAWAAALIAFAVSLRRRAEPWSALALGVLGILAWDSRVLADPSFQLSFAAVAALLRLGRPISRAIARRFVGTPRWLRWPVDVIAVSFAATLGTAPIVAYHFERISLIAPLANLPAAPLGSIVLVPLSFAGGLLQLLSPTLGKPVLQLAGWAADALIALAEYASAFPGADHPVAAPTLAVGGFYLVLLWILTSELRARLKRLGAGLAIGGLCAAIFLPSPFSGATGQLRITALAVGQGDAIVVELPSGEAIVVDTGPPGTRSIAPYLRQRGHAAVELLILSHPHADHTGGLNELSRAIPIRKVWWSGDRREAEDALLAPIAALCSETVRAGAPPLRIGEVEIEVLGPERAPEEARKVNDGSLVVRLRWGERSVLLAGDAEVSEERALLKSSPESLRAEVLKVGHHGSRTSSSRAFLEAVAPSFALISLGRFNRFGFPNREVIERFEARGVVVGMSDQGAVRLETEAEGPWRWVVD